MEPKPCVSICYSQASVKGEPFPGILNEELRRKPVECFAGDVKSVELWLWPTISDNLQVKEQLFMNYSKHKAQTSNSSSKNTYNKNAKAQYQNRQDY